MAFQRNSLPFSLWRDQHKHYWNLNKRMGHFHHSTIKWNFPWKGGVFYSEFNFYFILPPPTACQLSRARFKWWAEFIQGDRIRAELHITFIFKFLFPWLSVACNYSYMVKYCFFHIYLSWGLGVNAKEWNSWNNSFEKLLHGLKTHSLYGTNDKSM